MTAGTAASAAAPPSESKRGGRIYVTRLHLDPTRIVVQEALANPWRMHRLVARAGGYGSTLEGRALYRMEYRAGKPPAMIVQSPKPLSWEPLLECKAVSHVEGTKSWDPSEVRPGASFRFLALVVPTQSLQERVEDFNAMVAEIQEATGARVDASDVVAAWRRPGSGGWTVRRASGRLERYGRRSNVKGAVKGHEELEQWLARALRGANLTGWRDDREVQVDAEKYETGSDKPIRMSWSAHQFAGALTVVDPHAFAATVAHGIGSSKAFGFGLVSLARYA